MTTALPAQREAPRETGKRLATFPRRGGFGKPAVEVRVVLDAYEGRPFISIRTWEQGSDGNYYPTPKGVTIRTAELYETIRALCAGARELGVDLHPKGSPPGEGASGG